MTLFSTAVMILVASTAINIMAIVFFMRRGNDGMWLRVFLLLNYLIAYPMSGLAHVLGWSTDRGYYDALAGAPVGQGSGLLPAAWVTLIGLGAIILGLLFLRPAKSATITPSRSIFVERRPIAWGLALALLVVCGFSLLRIRSVVASLNAERVIAVDGGNARFVFLAAWLPIGVMMLALLLMRRRLALSAQARNVVILFFACGFIAAAMSYDGGRAAALLTAIPLLALFLPRIKALRTASLVVGGVALSLFIVWQTNRRSEGNDPFDFWSLFDWQWGRFSMVAWADKLSTVHGSFRGETFLSSLLAVPDALGQFLRLTLPFPDYRSAVEISGQFFRGSDESIFIVPGYISELFFNFGYLGIAIGCFILAVVAGKLADLYRDSRYEVERLLIATVATSVVFSTLVSQFEAFFLSLVLGFLPLWGLWLLERYLLREELPSSSVNPRRRFAPAHPTTK